MLNWSETCEVDTTFPKCNYIRYPPTSLNEKDAANPTTFLSYQKKIVWVF